MFDLRSNFNRKSSNRTSNQRSRVSNYSSHCRCCSYKRAGKQCSGTRSLASFKITVTGRHCILSGRHLIVVHCQASRTTRLANGKTGLFQNLVQSLFANLCIYHPGARNQPCHYILGFPTAFHNGGKCTEILNASIGAGTQKHIVNLLTQQRFSRLETHIANRLHERGPGSFSHAQRSPRRVCVSTSFSERSPLKKLRS